MTAPLAAALGIVAFATGSLFALIAAFFALAAWSVWPEGVE